MRSVAGADVASGAPMTIDYPLDGSMFPPEFVPPTFLWHDEGSESDRWLIDVSLGDEGHIYTLVEGVPVTPGEEDPRRSVLRTSDMNRLLIRRPRKAGPQTIRFGTRSRWALLLSLQR
jgi:hypothetical protein